MSRSSGWPLTVSIMARVLSKGDGAFFMPLRCPLLSYRNSAAKMLSMRCSPLRVSFMGLASMVSLRPIEMMW